MAQSSVKLKRQLVELYQDSGYMRVPNMDRREEEPGEYKKGYEIRLIARTKRDLAVIRRLLREVGLKAGKPFPKHSRWVQPVYGYEAMNQFKEWLKKFDKKKARR
jgi:hypothetical protein